MSADFVVSLGDGLEEVRGEGGCQKSLNRREPASKWSTSSYWLEATQAGLDNGSDAGVDTRGDDNNPEDDSIHAIVEDNFSTKLTIVVMGG